MASTGALGPHSPRPDDQDLAAGLHSPQEERVAEHELGAWFLADPDPLLVVAPTGALIQANPAGWRLLDASTAVSLRRGRVTFADAEAQLSFSRGLTEAMLNGGARAILRGNDGQWRPLELLAWR